MPKTSVLSLTTNGTMGDANWWETVANDFLSHYYTQFDAGVEARVQLAALYVRLLAIYFELSHFCTINKLLLC